MKLTINIDGGSRGNPGIGASGVVIKQDNKYLLKQGLFYKKCTNNQAEFMALKIALTRAKNLGANELEIISDSELLVKQYNGIYKIKNPDLKILMTQIKELATNFKKVSVKHVLREFNKEADLICNLTMDEGIKKHFAHGTFYTPVNEQKQEIKNNLSSLNLEDNETKEIEKTTTKTKDENKQKVKKENKTTKKVSTKKSTKTNPNQLELF